MAAPVVALPKFVVLQSTTFKSQPGKIYLRYVKEEGVVHGFVQCTGEYVGSSDAKFEVHISSTGNGLVHLRSCYSNKYLVKEEGTSHWIIAKAEQPEEDQTKQSCTLLRPTSVDGDPKKIRLTHVHLGNYLCSWTTTQPYTQCVTASFSVPDHQSFDVFKVIDWDSLVLLPRYLAFKGDNDKFLRAFWTENHEYLQFSSESVTQNPEVTGNEIIQNSDGTIRVKNLHWNKFWRRSPNWIWADSTDTTTNNQDTLFEPVKVDDNTIALRNLGNNLFCTRLNADGKDSCLHANSSEINQWARLKVSEHIISRTVTDINFRLMDSRIYNEHVEVAISTGEVNRSPNSTQKKTVLLSYTETLTSTWKANVSLKLGLKTSFSTGIPIIVDGKIEVSGEIGGGYEWGETKQTTANISTSHTVDIPPMTKVTVRVVQTRGSCDVPFSYTMRDVLYNGQTVTTFMDDGIYTGVNSYSTYTEVGQESLLNPGPAQFKCLSLSHLKIEKDGTLVQVEIPTPLKIEKDETLVQVEIPTPPPPSVEPSVGASICYEDLVQQLRLDHLHVLQKLDAIHADIKLLQRSSPSNLADDVDIEAAVDATFDALAGSKVVPEADKTGDADAVTD